MMEDPIKHMGGSDLVRFLSSVVFYDGMHSEFADIFDLSMVTEELVRKHRTKYMNEQLGQWNSPSNEEYLKKLKYCKFEDPISE